MNTSRRIKPVILKVAVSLMLFLAINIPSFAENSGGPATRDIYEAIGKNDIRSLKLLLEMDNVEYYNHSEAYPLLYAVRVSNTQAVQILLPYYSNTTLIKIDPFDENSKTILEEAESQNSPEIRRLIYNRVYSELNQDENIELLYLYLMSDFEAVRQGVISKKINIHTQSNKQKSLLHLCADKRDYNNRWFQTDVYLNEDNKVTLARFLIDQGIDPDLVDDSGDTALLLAIEYGYNTLATLLIDAGADVNGTDQTSRSPLEQALQYKNTIICEKLVKAGANLNELDDTGRTILAQSIDDKQFEFAKILIHGGADVNAKGEKGYSPLYEACDKSNLELCSLLIEKGADVNSKNGKYKTPPLKAGIYPDNYELVELLLSHGADANGKDCDGDNVLYDISSTEDLRIVKLLIDSGADVNAVNSKGLTPVLQAAGFGKLAILELFAKNKGNFLVKDTEGKTALHWAIEGALTKYNEIMHIPFYTGYTLTQEMVQFLLKKKIDVNAKNKKGQSALMLGVRGEFDQPEIAEILIRNKADVNLRDNNNNTVLMFAISNPKTVTVLLDSKIDPAIQNNEGKTALSIAEQGACFFGSNNQDLVQSAQLIRAAMGNKTPRKTLHEAVTLGYTDQILEMIGEKQDLNTLDKNGDSPVYCAVRGKNLKILQILIEHGADVNICKQGNMTPFCYATSNEYIEIMRMLIKAGADIRTPYYSYSSYTSPMKEALSTYGSRERNPEVVEILLDAGAGFESQIEKEDPPLLIAVRDSKPEIVKLLLDKGAPLFNTKGLRDSEKSILDAAAWKNRQVIRDKIDSLFVGKTFTTQDNLRLRNGSGTGSETLLTLIKGSRVHVLETGLIDTQENIQSCWVKVRTEPGAKNREGKSIKAGTEGWVFAGFLEE